MVKIVSNRVRAATAALVVAGLGMAAFAADPSGPAFGKNKFTTSLDTVLNQQDTDDYVSSLVMGEQLTVKVKASKGSVVRPSITLIDPDGEVIEAPTLPVKIKSKGKAAVLKKFVIPKTGRWAVRIGSDGTQGEYTVSFSVKAVKPLKFKKQTLGGASALVNTHEFEGTDGGLLDMTLKFKPKETAPTFTSITDPAAGEVPGQLGPLAGEATAKGKKKLLIQGAPISTGDGTYAVQVGIPAGTASYSLTVGVTPQDRPSGKKAVPLDPFEPFLQLAGAEPISGIAGREVRFSGQGFSFDPDAVPTVLFGDLPGADVSVGGGGAFIDVVVPNGSGTVSITVINPDKQSTSRDDYFFYLPPPVITDIVTLAGASARGATTEGGSTLQLVGENFADGSSILLGTSSALNVTLINSTRLQFETPPASPGDVTLRLRDSFERTVIPAFPFTFKRPPTFAADPYDPAAGPRQGGLVVTLTGDGFEAEDQLILGGVNAASTFVDATTRTFISPVSADSSDVPVALMDRFGSVVAGPDFAIKPAPVLTTMTATAGPRMGALDLPTAGGTTVSVIGSNFRDDDTASFGGTSVALLNRTATSFDFVVPAGVVGVGSLTVVDFVGQDTTLDGPVRYSGFVDATATRLPGGDSTDDYSAVSGALGDLDGDADRNDLAIVSQDSSPGTRYEYTRILSNTGGTLADDTYAEFPAYGADSYGYDYWQASAAAIGDLGGYYGNDYLVIAGKPTYYDSTTTYSYDFRVFGRTGGSATSTFYLESSYSPSVSYVPYIYDPSGYYYPYKLLEQVTPFNGWGTATSLALGDLDGDLDLEVVMGTDHYRAGYLHFPPNNYYAPYDQDGVFYIRYGGFYYDDDGYYYYFPGVRVFDNATTYNGYSFLDVSITRLPYSASSAASAFPTRDLELGDIDGDNDLDIVGTWDNPGTTTPGGLYAGTGTARLATHVLENNGRGIFTDRSTAWMPSTGTPEFWQGHQIELADMDGDNDLDMFLLLAQSTDAFQGPPTFGNHALRVLRNNSPSTGFTDVTTTVLPSVPLAGTLNDNLRGEALLVSDFNGDGFVDILIGTTETLTDASAVTIGSTRLLAGSSSGAFNLANEFLPGLTVDQGEAQDFLLGDLAGAGRASVTVLSEVKGTGEHLRVYDWTR